MRPSTWLGGLAIVFLSAGFSFGQTFTPTVNWTSPDGSTGTATVAAGSSEVIYVDSTLGNVNSRIDVTQTDLEFLDANKNRLNTLFFSMSSAGGKPPTQVLYYTNGAFTFPTVPGKYFLRLTQYNFDTGAQYISLLPVTVQ